MSEIPSEGERRRALGLPTAEGSHSQMDTYTLYTPRGHEAVMGARAQTSDYSVMGSTFRGVAGSGLVDEYDLKSLHIKGRFVDVGAHVGAVTVAVLLDNPEATAICVEPVPENVAVLVANLASNGLADRALVIQGAVGTDRVFYGFEGDEHLMTNRYIANLTGTVYGSERPKAIEIRVREVTLDELLPCDAMKLDCEGGEWGLFADPAITTIPLVFGEYHFGAGAEGVRATFEATHSLEFTLGDEDAGNFRAVRR